MRIVIKFYPQDGSTAIDREEIDVFLGRISSNMKGLILKVSPFGYEHNGQKITVLEVKESYKNQ